MCHYWHLIAKVPTVPLLPRLLQVLAIIAGARAALLFVQLRLAVGNVQRHHVESGVLAFVVIGLAALALLPRQAPDAPQDNSRNNTQWLAWTAAALVLYWPALGVGMLSDDFVLADRARHLDIGLVNREFFRPLPLLMWSAISRLAGPAGLHALNVLGHGLVAWLSCRLARPYVSSNRMAAMCGLVVLTFPATVEAVAWSSGIFDVSSTLLILAAALVARRYDDTTVPATRVALWGAVLLALLCKETAAVAPLLLLLDAWARGRVPRALAIDCLGLMVVLGSVGILRWTLASELVRRPVTRYVFQRWLFGTFSGVFVPWHSTVISEHPWVVLTTAVLTLLLAVAFVLGSTAARDRRAAILGGAWLLLGSLPTLTFFFVGDDLQGSRYLYLPVVGYALLLTTMAASVRLLKPVAWAVLAVVVAFGCWGLRANLQFWNRAGEARDAVLSAAAHDSRLAGCRAGVRLTGLPDVVEGAYVFRNGADVAFGALGLVLRDDAPPECRFAWADSGFASEREASSTASKPVQ